VFTANAGFVLDGIALLARFRHAERRDEQGHDRAFFESLRERGLVDSVVATPEDLHFEGAGDALWDATRGLIWTGWGQRSSRPMGALIAQLYSVPTVSLELVDPRFYHLDTCLCVLSGGDVIYYPAAFSEASRRLIVDLIGPDRLIEAAAGDADQLAVNSVCLGRDVVLCHASDALRATLTERGYRSHVVGLESFNRSGGSAYCLTLRLDQRSHAAEPGPRLARPQSGLKLAA
jgi:N-dimethylarginine dimethylaminohydrolase